MTIGKQLKPFRHKAPGAFTLVELVLSMAMISVVTVAVFAAITSGINTIRLARENSRATQILIEKLDLIRLYNWDQINANNFVPTKFDVPYDPATTNGTSLFTYHGKIKIGKAPMKTSYQDDLRLVTLQLEWTSPVNQLERKREISTYVCQSGIQNYVY